MFSFHQPALNGWHEGEKAIQKKLGFANQVQGDYDVVASEMSPHQRIFFQSNVTFLPIATLSPTSSQLWCSLLFPTSDSAFPPPPGTFIASSAPDILVIRFETWEGDPIRENLVDGALIAGVGVELSSRRRNKIAGRVKQMMWVDEAKTKGGIAFKTEEVTGNCPKYITTHSLTPHPSSPTIAHSHPLLTPSSPGLPPSLISFIHSTTSLYLATFSPGTPTHPPHLGCNHRGGPPGFLRVLPSSNGKTVVLPDFSGNRFLSSLGNIELSPLVGLAIPDFGTGDILYLSGKAENFVGDAAEAIMERSKLVTKIEITGYIFVQNALPLRDNPHQPTSESPYNPTLRYLQEERLATGFISLSRGSASPTAKLVGITKHAPDIARFDFDIQGGSGEAWKAGHYVIMDCVEMLGGGLTYQHMTGRGREKEVNEDGVRTWTISSAPDPTNPTHFSTTIRLLPSGLISPHLFSLLPSSSPLHTLSPPRRAISFPLLGIGGAFLLPEKPGKMLWLAGGIGITPFLAFLAQMGRQDGPWGVRLVVGSREPGEVVRLVRDAMGKKGKERIQLELHVFTSAEVGKGVAAEEGGFSITIHPGRLAASSLKSVGLEHGALGHTYICGPPEFEKVAQEAVIAMGGDPAEITREKFNY